jgi:trimethylamine--corrinoid protein Co-methyltransferase
MNQATTLLNVNGGYPVHPGDVPPEKSHLLLMLAPLLLSDKCLLGIPGKKEKIEDVLEMASIGYGGWDNFTKGHHLVTLISIISPLVVDEAGLDSVITCATANQPILVCPAPAAGTTGPIHLAGNLALGTAEVFALISLAQMIKPGVPCVFGLQLNVADMATGGIDLGSPAYAIQIAVNAALGRFLKIPTRGGGSTTMAKTVGVRSSSESMATIFNSIRNKINLIIHCAGILDNAASMSYEKYISDLEGIRWVDFYARGLSGVDKEDLCCDIIHETGPGGQFLTHPSTLEHCRKSRYKPLIKWRSYASEMAALTGTAHELIASYERPEMETGCFNTLMKTAEQKGAPTPLLKELEQQAGC